MNVFVIPFWYPSADYPLNGIFVREQLEAICNYDTSLNIGVGLWGQKDERYLLWVKDHLRNLQKLITADTKPYSRSILPNLKEYHQPAFTWTRKILHGNRRSALKALLANFDRFEKEFGPVNLIHAHVGEIAGQLAMELAQIKGLPYLITEHMGPFPGYYASDKKGRLKPSYLKPYLSAAANIAVSPFLEQAMQQQSIPHTIVIPNFIDAHCYAPKPKQHNHPFTYFTLARLTTAKGIDQLLYATELLIKTQPQVIVKIGGSGPDEQSFRKLTETLGITNHVQWLGDLTREQVVNEYQACDAFILPSQYETFGIVYIEALACGKPVIATKCGGPESIVNEANGLLIDKNNPEALASAMNDMIRNYDLYNTESIRQDFMDRFSTKAVAPKLVTLYKAIITKHSPDIR